MRTWWDRLIASPRALAAVAGGIVVVAVVAAVLVVSGGGDDTPASAAEARPSATADVPDEGPAAEDVPDEDEPDAPLPPDKDEYCPAFEQIQTGGLSDPSDEDEDGQVDLAELSRTFDGLLDRYQRAERVSPLSLRDDYAQALGYLRQGKRATESRDVELLRALATNLDSLNDSMTSIQRKSARFCD